MCVSRWKWWAQGSIGTLIKGRKLILEKDMVLKYPKPKTQLPTTV